MAERGARPQVPEWRLRGLRALRALFTPLLPDDYLELINPLWSTQELRGRIERIEREAGDAVTVVIKPGWEWPGHQPGQYLRVGMPVDGIHHWRAYSITSDPDREDGCISITPKLVETGKVSPYLVQAAQPGTLVRLGGVEGAFTLPDPLPSKLLFISAGSGITPIMSMLRSIDCEAQFVSVVHLHSARTADEVIFGAELRELVRRNPTISLHEQHTAKHGRMTPADLDRLCPDWRERETFLSGPADMLAAMTDPLEGAGRQLRPPARRALPALPRRRGGRAGRRRHDPLPHQRPDRHLRRLAADPGGRGGSRRRASVRLPHGDLPHLRRAPLLRPCSRPAHRRCPWPERRDGPHLHQRARGRDRDRTVTPEARTRWRA